MDEHLCECGCGEPAGFYATTAKGHRVGEPKRFINGHNGRAPGGGRPPEPLESRYDVRDLGYETPCWVWRRTLGQRGYARMWDPARGRIVQASRFFYEYFIGPIPDGLQLDHLCHDPRTCPGGNDCPHRACVNPAHLEPVTQHVNQQRGANAKLTRQMADEIRRRGRAGTAITVLAHEFGVSIPVADAIVDGHSWP